MFKQLISYFKRGNLKKYRFRMVGGENLHVPRLNEISDELEEMKLEDKECELKILEDKIIWNKSTPEIISNAKESFLQVIIFRALSK